MAKAKTIFTCQSCGGTSLRWQGQCPHCQEWNTLEETIEQVASKKLVANRFNHLAAATPVRRLADVQMQTIPRMSTGSDEFDRVLGGGLVPGSVVLIGGDPGIGKSTLLLQVLTSLSTSEDVLYVTGEESDQQVALRAKRLELNTESVQLLAEIQLEAIQQAVNELNPKVVVIDSIQTMFSGELTAAPGSVSQVRECAAQLTRMA